MNINFDVVDIGYELGTICSLFIGAIICAIVIAMAVKPFANKEADEIELSTLGISFLVISLAVGISISLFITSAQHKIVDVTENKRENIVLDTKKGIYLVSSHNESNEQSDYYEIVIPNVKESYIISSETLKKNGDSFELNIYTHMGAMIF